MTLTAIAPDTRFKKFCRAATSLKALAIIAIAFVAFAYLINLVGHALGITSENVGGTVLLFVVFTALNLGTIAVVGQAIASKTPDVTVG